MFHMSQYSAHCSFCLAVKSLCSILEGRSWQECCHCTCEMRPDQAVCLAGVLFHTGFGGQLLNLRLGENGVGLSQGKLGLKVCNEHYESSHIPIYPKVLSCLTMP